MKRFIKRLKVVTLWSIFALATVGALITADALYAVTQSHETVRADERFTFDDYVEQEVEHVRGTDFFQEYVEDELRSIVLFRLQTQLEQETYEYIQE